MKNWQTTVGGILASSGISLQLINDNTVKIIGIVVGAIGALLMGVFATQEKKEPKKDVNSILGTDRPDDRK